MSGILFSLGSSTADFAAGIGVWSGYIFSDFAPIVVIIGGIALGVLIVVVISRLVKL